MRMRTDRRPVAISLLMLMVAVACGSGDQGIDVQKLQADLSFGVREITTDAPPANFSQPPTTVVSEEPPLRPTRTPVPFLAAPVPAADCPDAAINAFPEQPAPDAVQNLPAQGTYRWKVTAEGEESFQKRYIRSVEEINDQEFTYELVQPDGTEAVAVTTWRVNSAGISQGVGGGSGTTRRRYGASNAGVALERVDRYDHAGNMLGSFQPVAPVLYFPLPLAQGEAWTSTGIDLISGQRLEHSGEVIRRERVDACGEIVEGWLVEGQQVFRGSDGERIRRYDYVVGLGEGGVLLSERVEQASPDPAITTFDIGQVVPDPLETGLPG